MSKPIEASIVVVDDEPSIRELLVASLHFAGFEVNTAASGSEAIEVIEKIQPDLIVLDVMLPDIDGFTVTRRIRQEGITTPVLYLTARDDTQDKVMGLTVGGDDYVTKPFSTRRPEQWMADPGCGYTVQTDVQLWMRDRLVEAIDIVPFGYADTLRGQAETEENEAFE